MLKVGLVNRIVTYYNLDTAVRAKHVVKGMVSAALYLSRNQKMKIINKLMPDKAQAKLLNQPGPSGSVFMINLIKFKSKASYEDDRNTDLSGREAYRIYGMGVVKMLPQYNAEVVVGAHITELIIGEADELWDEISVVKYASRQDLNNMTSSQEWKDLNVHRLAGLAGQLNIESVQPS